MVTKWTGKSITGGRPLAHVVRDSIARDESEVFVNNAIVEEGGALSVYTRARRVEEVKLEFTSAGRG